MAIMKPQDLFLLKAAAGTASEHVRERRTWRQVRLGFVPASRRIKSSSNVTGSVRIPL